MFLYSFNKSEGYIVQFLSCSYNSHFKILFQKIVPSALTKFAALWRYPKNKLRKE